MIKLVSLVHIFGRNTILRVIGFKHRSLINKNFRNLLDHLTDLPTFETFVSSHLAKGECDHCKMCSQWLSGFGSYLHGMQLISFWWVLPKAIYISFYG